MIRYDLKCENGDEFDAWFGSIADYDKQAEAGLIECPHCGSTHVGKAPMAPAVRTSRKKEAQKERAVAMVFKAVGLKPQGRLSDWTTRAIWNFVRWRIGRLERLAS